MNTDLYIINLSENIAHLERCQNLLSPDECMRMMKFATPTLRHQFVLTRGILRMTLAPYLALDAAHIQFQYSKLGKPSVHNHPLQFNLTHAGHYAVIVITEKDVIGVDIERYGTTVQPIEIAKRFFTPNESYAVENAHDPSHLFFHIWTQKEAFLKAIGQGIAFGLDQFEVSTDLELTCIHSIQNPEYAKRVWDSRSFTFLPDYRIALTKENKLNTINVIPFSSDSIS